MMIVRKANLNDVIKTADLFDQYRVWYRKKSDINAARNFLSQRIENRDSVIFIAEDANKSLAGFTQCYPLFSSTRMKRLWLLNDLFVHPDFRGQRVSKLLIGAAKDLCRETNACGVMLETEKSNTVGNQLYPATGFVMNETHNYYEWEVENK